LGSIEDVIHCDIGRALHKKGSNNNDYSTTGMYSHTEENGDGAYLTTRAHCEDRMSCALALGSTNEFLYWLRLYVRNLSCHGSSTQLRFLLQIFLGHELKDVVNEEWMNDGEVNNSVLCPWWTAYKRACGTNWDGVDIVQKIILPEMSKNTSLRRLVYEIDTEIKLTLIR
jgi:protein HIRA/HIR1